MTPASTFPVTGMLEKSSVRFSIPTLVTGILFAHQACGLLPEDQFGIRIAGAIPTVYGPVPDTDVICTTCNSLRPERAAPTSSEHTLTASHSQICPVSVFESSNWSRKISCPAAGAV